MAPLHVTALYVLLEAPVSVRSCAEAARWRGPEAQQQDSRTAGVSAASQPSVVCGRARVNMDLPNADDPVPVFV